MSYFTKNSIMMWVVIAVIIINFTAIGTIIFKIYHVENRIHENHDRPCAQNILERELNLTPVQAEKFKMLKDAHRDSVSIIHQKMKDQRNFISENMVKSAPDTAMLNRAAEELGYLYSRTRKLYIKHYFDLRKECSPEQQKKLEKIYARIFCHDDCVPGTSGVKCDNRNRGYKGCNSKHFRN